MTNNPRIVVGVDGSPLSMNAVEFAVEETQLRHGHLHVTYAYPVMAKPVTGSTGKDYYEQVEDDAREVLEGIKSSAPSTEGIEVEWLAVPGNPAEVLIEASNGAALLVVGSRGVGGFKGLMMGSVSTQCVHHSHCPVLVVRADH
ncbi:MAG: universal stress protein [Acidimicrobiales bacterium]|jgi:nucleotide-binding universal stress UspA family protein